MFHRIRERFLHDEADDRKHEADDDIQRILRNIHAIELAVYNRKHDRAIEHKTRYAILREQHFAVFLLLGIICNIDHLRDHDQHRTDRNRRDQQEHRIRVRHDIKQLLPNMEQLLMNRIQRIFISEQRTKQESEDR